MEITDEELKQYTNEEYELQVKNMNLVTLHNVSEQRCKTYGCQLHKCVSQKKDINKCLSIFREMNKCIDKERQKVIYEYIKIKKQPLYYILYLFMIILDQL